MFTQSLNGMMKINTTALLLASSLMLVGLSGCRSNSCTWGEVVRIEPNAGQGCDCYTKMQTQIGNVYYMSIDCPCSTQCGDRVEFKFTASSNRDSTAVQ